MLWIAIKNEINLKILVFNALSVYAIKVPFKFDI